MNKITIEEALREFTLMEGCPQEQEQRVKWLSRLDGRVYRELMLPRVGAPKDFDGYDIDTDLQTELLIPEPYGDVYTHWLRAQNAIYNGENEAYEDAVAAFEVAWNAFSADYIRSHPGKCAGRIRF